MKVQLSATIDAELSVRMSERIKESDMSKSAYIQTLIEKDLGFEKSVIPEKIEVSKKVSKKRLVYDVLRTSKQDTITSPALRLPKLQIHSDGGYYYPFGKEESTYNAVPMARIFADDRLSHVRKTELEEILRTLSARGEIIQPKKDYFLIV